LDAKTKRPYGNRITVTIKLQNSKPGFIMGMVVIMDTILGGNLTNAPLPQNLHPGTDF
jgi:hypothetical protein